jgi:hypothetical protein
MTLASFNQPGIVIVEIHTWVRGEMIPVVTTEASRAFLGFLFSFGTFRVSCSTMYKPVL